MAHKVHIHEHKRIPSPIPAVNQYEGIFLRAGNRFMAEAVADVIAYVKRATEDVIRKDGKIDLEEVKEQEEEEKR